MNEITLANAAKKMCTLIEHARRKANALAGGGTTKGRKQITAKEAISSGGRRLSAR